MPKVGIHQFREGCQRDGDCPRRHDGDVIASVLKKNRPGDGVGRTRDMIHTYFVRETEETRGRDRNNERYRNKKRRQIA